MGTVPAPYVPVAGDDATQARVLTWADACNYLLGNATSGGSKRPLAIMRQTVAQSIPNITSTAVTLDTEDVDYDSGHSTVTNTSRYTAATAGLYLITGSLAFAANATGERGILLRQNGGTILAAVRVNTDSSTSAQTALSASVIAILAVGDFIEINAYQNSTAALNTDVTLYPAKLTVAWLSV